MTGKMMKKPFRFESRGLAILLLIMLSTVPAFFYLLYNAEQVRKERETEAAGNALRITRLIAQYQATLVQNTSDLLMALSQAPSIGRGDWALCTQYLRQILASNARYSNLGVADAEGRVVCNALPQSTPGFIGDRQYFRQAVASKQRAIGTFQIDRFSGQQSIGVGYPVLDAQGEVKVVAYAALKAEALMPPVGEIALRPGATLQIFDAQGTLLARIPAEPALVGGDIVPRALFDATRAPGDGALFEERNQHRYLYTYSGASAAGTQQIGVAMAAPIDDLLVQQEQRHWRDLAGVVVMMGSVLLVGWLLAQMTISRQLRTLAEATRRVGQGDFTTRVQIGAERGELAALASGFDAMMRRIGRRTGRLQQAAAALENQKELLAMIAAGQPLDVVLRRLVHLVEMQVDDALCALSVYERGSQRLRAVEAPHLPAAFLAEIGDMAVPGGGDLAVEDVVADGVWDPHRTAVLLQGVRGRWSQPLMAGDGRRLGVLSLYFHEARAPAADEVALLKEIGAIAVLALQAEQRRKSAPAAIAIAPAVVRSLSKTPINRH